MLALRTYTHLLFYKFNARNVSIFTLSGFKQDLFGVTICPDLLKSLLEGQLVAQTHKYFLAKWERNGYVPQCISHHDNRSNSLSGDGDACLANKLPSVLFFAGGFVSVIVAEISTVAMVVSLGTGNKDLSSTLFYFFQLTFT